MNYHDQHKALLEALQWPKDLPVVRLKIEVEVNKLTQIEAEVLTEYFGIGNTVVKHYQLLPSGPREIL